MRRGDLVTVSAPGDYGRPHPALIVQADALDGADSVLVGLMTSTLRDAPLYRLTVEPSATNGLRTTSQVMLDKLMAVPRAKSGPVIGRLDEAALAALDRGLAIMLGLAG